MIDIGAADMQVVLADMAEENLRLRLVVAAQERTIKELEEGKASG